MHISVHIDMGKCLIFAVIREVPNYTDIWVDTSQRLSSRTQQQIPVRIQEEKQPYALLVGKQSSTAAVEIIQAFIRKLNHCWFVAHCGSVVRIPSSPGKLEDCEFETNLGLRTKTKPVRVQESLKEDPRLIKYAEARNSYPGECPACRALPVWNGHQAVCSSGSV